MDCVSCQIKLKLKSVKCKEVTYRLGRLERLEHVINNVNATKRTTLSINILTNCVKLYFIKKKKSFLLLALYHRSNCFHL